MKYDGIFLSPQQAAGKRNSRHPQSEQSLSVSVVDLVRPFHHKGTEGKEKRLLDEEINQALRIASEGNGA